MSLITVRAVPLPPCLMRGKCSEVVAQCLICGALSNRAALCEMTSNESCLPHSSNIVYIIQPSFIFFK